MGDDQSWAGLAAYVDVLYGVFMHQCVIHGPLIERKHIFYKVGDGLAIPSCKACYLESIAPKEVKIEKPKRRR